MSSAPAEPAPAPIPASAPCGASRPVAIRHLVVIVMENHSYGQIIGHAPYIDRLAGACGLATHYHAISHPSLPNYLAMTSGSTWGISSDCSPAQCPVPRNSIFAQIGGRHMLWHVYAESIPSPCARQSSGEYAVKHNPAAYYTVGGVRSHCAARISRAGNPGRGPLRTALYGSMPAYSFVVPNLCDDMHDCPVSTGDAWLSAWIPAIVRSPAYQSRHTAIVITFDEDDGAASNHVATLVVSPATPRGARSAQPFTHYSLLRTSEYLFGARFLGGAAHATGLSRAFRLY
ncbi:MAG: alkaline phosphatase family protein [Gaiellales bacterium]